MKKDFVKGIAVGCALSMAIGGASALADTYRKFLEVAYTDIKVVVNGKPTTPRDSDGTPVKPFISSGTTYLPVRSISNALGQNVDWDSDTSTIYIGDKLETDKVNMAKIEPVEGTHILNSSSATFPLRQVTIVPDNRFAPYSDNDDDINAVQFINEDTDEVLATVSNKRLEKAVDVRVNLIGVDKLRVKAGRISDDNNFEFGYNGGYLYNLYLTPITQK